MIELLNIYPCTFLSRLEREKELVCQENARLLQERADMLQAANGSSINQDGQPTDELKVEE